MLQQLVKFLFFMQRASPLEAAVAVQVQRSVTNSPCRACCSKHQGPDPAAAQAELAESAEPPTYPRGVPTTPRQKLGPAPEGAGQVRGAGQPFQKQLQPAVQSSNG